MSLLRHSFLAVFCLAAAAPLSAQTVRYEVSARAPATQLFHVSAEFPTAGTDTLRVSLPAWSPGYYQIKNYARYVRGFAARDAGGRALFWDRQDKDTWRVVTGGAPSVTVEFDFLSDRVDLADARLSADFGVFLGTTLFLFEEGKLDRPAEVRFAVPAGWDVMTALRRGASGAYTAADYHELADAMTFLGRFSRDSLQVSGAWLRIATWPATAYTPAVARNLRSTLERLVGAQNRLMGGPPYDVYTVFLNIFTEPLESAGGLEHSDSHFDIMPAEAFADPAGNLGPFMKSLLSHEIFHLWNVKRVRPAEMWPYDYRAEQYTPLLWWSEGVTDYFSDLAAVRSGVWSDAEWIANITSNIDQTETAPEPWSAEDGSAATWIDEVYVNSSGLYYPKGSLLGLLLDVSIRDATGNARSLDDVMRALYTRFARQGRGFTTADLLAVLRETGMPDVDGFYSRYVNGREPLPYETVLPKAGIAVNRQTTTTPFFGVSAQPDAEGRIVVQSVVAGSSAASAGLQPGDELLRVGDAVVTAGADWAVAFRQRYAGRDGAPLPVVVRREGRETTLAGVVRERSRTRITVGRAPQPTAAQQRVWRGLTTGT